MRIELDDVLHGSPTWNEVQRFFADGEEFYEEGFLVAAIKRHLRTDEDKAELAALDVSIEEVLNGRYQFRDSEKIAAILIKWNAKLGCTYFRV